MKKEDKRIYAYLAVPKFHLTSGNKADDFALVEEELPELQAGEFLYRSLFISVDPYQRPYTARIPAAALPVTMIGSCVAVIEKSRSGCILR